MNMAKANILSDLKIWIFAGVILALIVGPIGDFSSTILIFVLILQMTLSMDSLSLDAKSIKKNSKPIVYSVIACFGISTIVTLAIGSLFMADHPEIWKGWIMLAAVPCAVSCVAMSFYFKGNTTMCVLSLAVIYFIALAATPLITWALMGENVSVLRIFAYVILFVVIPMAASIPLKKVNIPRNTRMIAINILMFAMVFLALGANRNVLHTDPDIVLLIIAACVIRVFVVSFLMLYIFKKRGSSRENAVVYVPMAVWKNSGLATTLCFVVFGSAAVAALPCAISLLIEVLWFALLSAYLERLWPRKEDSVSAADS